MTTDKELLIATDKEFHASIVQGVVKDAHWALEAKRFRAAVILAYCGIDTMASLMRPADNPQVNREGFVEWVENFMDFRNENGPTGLELYAARCGILHANMAESKLSIAGKVRMIGYVDKAAEPVLTDKNVENMILLSTTHLVGIMAEGVLKSWRSIKESQELLFLVHERLNRLFQEFDIKKTN